MKKKHSSKCTLRENSLWHLVHFVWILHTHIRSCLSSYSTSTSHVPHVPHVPHVGEWTSMPFHISSNVVYCCDNLAVEGLQRLRYDTFCRVQCWMIVMPHKYKVGACWDINCLRGNLNYLIILNLSWNKTTSLYNIWYFLTICGNFEVGNGPLPYLVYFHNSWQF